MKRFLIILCALAFGQIHTSCGYSPVSGKEATVLCSAAAETELSVPSNGQSVKVRNAVVNFVKELNGNQMPKTGAELTCCEFESAIDALSFVCSNLLLHPDKETFPYDRKKDCYDYRSECLQLQFKESASRTGVVAKIDIRFLTAYRDVKADTHYTVLFKKR